MSEPATLILRRANFELRRNNGRKVLVNEKYGPDVSVCLSPQILSRYLSTFCSLFFLASLVVTCLDCLFLVVNMCWFGGFPDQDTCG